MIFPRWPEFIVDFNVFVIAAYPKLYENYIFFVYSRTTSLVPKVTARGPENFFFYFLYFLSSFATNNSKYLHTDRQ